MFIDTMSGNSMAQSEEKEYQARFWVCPACGNDETCFEDDEEEQEVCSNCGLEVE